MASTVRIKTHGNSTLEGIELENFSTEDTLVAILEQIKSFADSVNATSQKDEKSTKTHQTKLEKWMQSLFGGAIGGAVPTGLGIGELTPEVLGVVVAFKLVTLGLQLFQGTLNFISRSITSIFWVAGSLVGTFISGKVAMSDYFDAIANGTKSLPIIETFTSLLADGSKYLNSWNQTVIDLTKMGGNFGGSISTLIIGAADAGLTVEQFANVIKENAEGLKTFGTVMDGVNTYTRVSRISMQEYSGQLADLGISFAQYSEELPRILSLFGASMKAHGASDKELAQSAFELTTQFDAMSQITGKSRDQQAIDLQKLTEDAAWQQKMTHLSGDEAAKYAQVLNEISSTSGNAYAELYKLTVLGMPPLTKELQTLIATTPGLNTEFQKMTEIVKSGVTGAALGKQLDDVAADMVATGIKAGQSFETLIAASTAGLTGSASDIASVQKELLANKQEFFENGVFNEDRYRQQLDQDRKRLDSSNAVTKNLNAFSNLLTNLRDQIYVQVIGPLVKNISPLITTIVNELSKNIGSFQGITTLVIGLVDDFSKWLKTADLKSDIDDFIETIKTVISLTISVMKLAWDVVKFVADNWDWIKLVVTGIVVALGTKGLLMALDGAISLLGKFGFGLGNVLGTLTKFIGLGGSTAEIGAAAGGVSLTGGEAAGGIAALAGGEAATGIGLPIAGLTLLAAGGVALWAYFANKKAEDQQKKQEDDEKTKKDNDNQETLNKLNDALMKLHELQQENNRHLLSIADNTGSSAKSGRKTVAALY